MRPPIVRCDNCQKDVDKRDAYKVTIIVPRKPHLGAIDLCDECAEALNIKKAGEIVAPKEI